MKIADAFIVMPAGPCLTDEGRSAIVRARMATDGSPSAMRKYLQWSADEWRELSIIEEVDEIRRSNIEDILRAEAYLATLDLLRDRNPKIVALVVDALVLGHEDKDAENGLFKALLGKGKVEAHPGDQ